MQLGDALALVDFGVEGMDILGVEAATHAGLAGGDVADPVVESMSQLSLETTQTVAKGGPIRRRLGAQIGDDGTQFREATLHLHPSFEGVGRQRAEFSICAEELCDGFFECGVEGQLRLRCAWFHHAGRSLSVEGRKPEGSGAGAKVLLARTKPAVEIRTKRFGVGSSGPAGGVNVERMEVLRLHGARDVRLHSEPRPIPGPGEDLVRVTAVGLCGSDLHWFEEGGIGTDRVKDPFVLGHEMGGVITSGERAGERVVIEPANPCGNCEVCRSGHSNLCQQVQFCGHYPTPGGLSTFIAWPGHLLLPVPDSIEGDQVALLEPLGIALHALDLAHFQMGMTAGVYGCGPIGLMLIQALRATGAGFIRASDPLPHRLDAARAAGADDVRITDVAGKPHQ